MFVNRGGFGLYPTDPAHDAWQVTLDRIELDVIRAERALLLGAELRTDEWVVPAHHGPVPPALQARGAQILARQLLVLERLAERLSRGSRQQAPVVRGDTAGEHVMQETA